MDNPYISHPDLVSKYFYDPETGIFHSRFCRDGENIKIESNDPRKGAKINDRCSQDGYIYLAFGYHEIRADRLAWFYVHGKWPNGELEHIDGKLDNNAISNLKIVPWKKEPSTNEDGKKTTLPRGVYLMRSGKYEARTCKNYKQIYLGCFDTVEEAYLAYENAKKQKASEDVSVKRIRKRKNILDDDEENEFKNESEDDDLDYEPKINTRGVSKQWNGTFIARIFDGKKTKSLGTYKNFEDALERYQSKKRKMLLDKRKFKDTTRD